MHHCGVFGAFMSNKKRIYWIIMKLLTICSQLHLSGYTGDITSTY